VDSLAISAAITAADVVFTAVGIDNIPAIAQLILIHIQRFTMPRFVQIRCVVLGKAINN
jgi:hypothetical protein